MLFGARKAATLRSQAFYQIILTMLHAYPATYGVQHNKARLSLVSF